MREAVKDWAPPGSVPREDYLSPEFTVQAKALVRGILCNRRAVPSLRVSFYSGPPMTLGNAAVTPVGLIGWCKVLSLSHQIEPDPAETAARCGAGTAVLDWRERLVCSRCGSTQP